MEVAHYYNWHAYDATRFYKLLVAVSIAIFPPLCLFRKKTVFTFIAMSESMQEYHHQHKVWKCSMEKYKDLSGWDQLNQSFVNWLRKNWKVTDVCLDKKNSHGTHPVKGAVPKMLRLAIAYWCICSPPTQWSVSTNNSRTSTRLFLWIQSTVMSLQKQQDGRCTHD